MAAPRPSRRMGERAPVTSRLAAVLRAWPALLLAAALPLLLAYGYLNLFSPTYRATASVFADGDIGGATSGDARRSHLELVTARPVLDRVAVRGTLADDFAALAAPDMSAKGAELLARIRGERASGTANAGQNAARLAAALNVAASDKANIIDITIAAGTPSAAARLANAVAEAFVEEASSLARPANSRANARGQDIRRRLREAEAALTAAGAGSPDASRIAGLRTRLEEATRMLNAGHDPAAIADVLRSPNVERLKVRYDEAKAQERSLSASLGQRHPSTIAATQHAAETAKILSEAVRLSVTAMKTEVEQASGDSPASGTAAADDARRALERIRAEYEAYLRTPEGAAEGNAARIVRRAEPPAENGAKPVGTIWLAAAALSALFALMVAVRAYRRAPPPRPEANASRERRRTPRQTVTEPPEPTGDAPRRRAADARGIAEPSVQPPALSMRDMVTDLSDKAWRQALQTLLVAGADRDAMATTALALASELARKHLRVLLLDADEAHPYLSRKLGHAPIAGEVLLHGQARALASLQGEHGEAFWLAPALSSLDGAPITEPLIVPGLAGHFDVLILVGPDMRSAGEVSKLAHAADRVIVPAVPGQARPASSVAATLELPAEKVQVLRTTSAPSRAGNLIRLDLAR